MRRVATIIVLTQTLFTTNVGLAKDIIPTSLDTPVLGELERVLVDALLNGVGINDEGKNDASLASVNQTPAVAAQIKKHHLRLFGGPMLGCVTDRSAKIWLRTPVAADVQIVFGKQADLSDARRSKEVRTKKDGDLTAIIGLIDLEPLTTYYYDVVVDGEAALDWRPSFRTAPSRDQKAKFKIAFGGGARVNPDKERIWNSVAAYRPDAFLFLGDNLYIDDPEHRNRHRLYYYRRQLRPEFQRLTAGTAAYAIWDDHDFGKNDCAGGLDPFKPDWKVPVWKVFKENWVNPYYGGGDEQPGCWFDFSIGDVDFFMTDGRYYRSFKDGTMLGPAQKKWLLEKLKASRATFKVIASGTLWTETADKGGKDSWWGVPKEREEIFSLIDRERIGGVILLSADRHRTDVYEIKRPNGYTLYEFETSKLTNNHTHGTKSQALFSYNQGNFFGMITFDLMKDDPELTFECITIDKKSVYSLTLKRSQLQAE